MDPVSKKLILSRDIIFDEENWIENSDSAVVSFNDGSQGNHGMKIKDGESENTTQTSNTTSPHEKSSWTNDSSSLNSQLSPQDISNRISREEKHTQAYDHSPLRWRRLDDVFAQCNVCIMQPENYRGSLR